MPSLRFTAEAERQLQSAHSALNGTSRQRDYDAIVSTLTKLERDAALFTLLEATALPVSGADVYGVVVETHTSGRPVIVVYELGRVDDAVVIHTIGW